MDVVSGLLDGPRARGAFLLRSHLTAPWGMCIEDGAPLTIIPVLRGSAWVGPAVGGADDDGIAVETGDVVLLRGPEHYVVADSAATHPTVVVGPTDECRAIDGGPSPMTVFGVRSWGNDLNGETVIITGTYPLGGAVGRRVLTALPHRVVLRRGDVDPTLVDLRAWLDHPEAPGWYRADADPVIGTALRLIHHDPAHPWSVESLAREVGLSRAAFARRFQTLVGEPPMSYLAGWRIDMAADMLLADPDATLAFVARAVGYSSPFALSAAFKRVRGLSPAQHRLRES